jgi:TatD DNase family protein
MEFFDTHAHYNDEQFENDREKIIEEIYKEGVTKVVVVGYNVEKSKSAIEIANKYEYIYSAVGIHPSDIEKEQKKIIAQISEIKKLAVNKKTVAIGEIGLDYHWNKENKELQKYAFIEQIKLANELELPIIIHTRDAIKDTIEILRGNILPKYSGILHCCTLNKELIEAGLNAGLYISFAGPITFKNTKNKEIINIVPDDRILIETDAPYLSPEPLRGKRNDSRNLMYIAKEICKIKEIDIEKFANLSYNNARRIYKI